MYRTPNVTDHKNAVEGPTTIHSASLVISMWREKYWKDFEGNGTVLQRTVPVYLTESKEYSLLASMPTGGRASTTRVGPCVRRKITIISICMDCGAVQALKDSTYSSRLIAVKVILEGLVNKIVTQPTGGIASMLRVGQLAKVDTS